MKTSTSIISLTVLFLSGCATSGVSVQDQSQSSIALLGGGSRKIIKKIAPDYPADLRVNHITGTVVVRFWIRPDGTVAKAEARSSPNPELSRLAVAAMEQWVFEPAPEGDKRILVLENPLTFQLENRR